MRRIITKAQSIKFIIYAIAVIAIITIFPLRLWHENISTCGKEHAAGTVVVGGENTAMQQFSAEYDHISSIGVYIQGEYYSDSLCLRVFDANFTLLREQTVSTDTLKKIDSKSYNGESGYADVYINLDVTVGDTYYYTVEGISTDFVIPYEMTGNSGTLNNGLLQYAGENKDAYNLITRYTYEQPLRKLMSLIWIIGILAVCVMATIILNLISKKKESLTELCTLQWILKRVGNPVIIIVAIAAIVIVGPLHMFSIYIADIIVEVLGILLLAATLLYAINHDSSTDGFDPIDYLRDNWQNLAQAICIALALWACVNYMNALYEVFHDIAWRKMAFFLGLAIVVTFTRREALNLYNLALLIAGVITARIYYVQNLPAMTDEYHVEAMLWTCRCMPLILILIAYFVRSMVISIKSKTNPLKMVSWPYTILTIVLAVAMIVRRNTRYWPVMMTVIVAVIAIRYLFWENRNAFLTNICNGILIHFGACILYCLWHRPYEAYRYVRYPFVFHTVTITAEYMSLVLAAAAVKLFGKYNRTKQIKACLVEIFVFGTAAVYTLFTMSRTGMIAVVAMGLVMWVAYSFGPGMKRIKYLALSAGMVIVSVLWCLPIFFSLQKIIPAVVGEPETMIVEVYPEEVLVSTDWDSEEFITFTRFSKAFVHKMFGINEDRITWDKYTINGTRENMYLNYFESEELKRSTDTSSEEASAKAEGYGILLSGEDLSDTAEDIQDFFGEDGEFIPPHQWKVEGEPPAEFYDADYWMYDENTQSWEFNIWKYEQEQNQDISNGRMDIYRAYYEQLNNEGHEGMGAILADGSEAAHAHDIYLQVAYDHGKIVGMLFILWVAFTCIQALIVFIRRRKVDFATGMVLAVSVTYAVAGLTEWISHPCNPVGMIMMIMVVPLAFYKNETRKTTV